MPSPQGDCALLGLASSAEFDLTYHLPVGHNVANQPRKRAPVALVGQLALLERGRLRLCAPLDEVNELSDLRAAGVASPLLQLALRWLRDAR